GAMGAVIGGTGCIGVIAAPLMKDLALQLFDFLIQGLSALAKKIQPKLNKNKIFMAPRHLQNDTKPSKPQDGKPEFDHKPRHRDNPPRA
ncbi:MAG: hypothetical protein JWM09_1474, partial [Francisellaceae bacterium]|nr:hypothetical protein [Francisellaceae bacterium]